MNSAPSGLWTVVLALHQMKLVARLTVGDQPLNLASLKYVFISRLFFLKMIYKLLWNSVTKCRLKSQFIRAERRLYTVR